MPDIFINDQFASYYKRWPLVLIDLGASGGIAQRWRRAERYLQVVGFEPDERAFKELNSTNNIRYINTALSDSDSELELFLTKKQECSSIFPPDYDVLRQFPYAARFDVVDRPVIQAKKLNVQLLQNYGIYDPDFLKIDVQGGEFNILRGAADLLDNFIFGIEVEVEFLPIYKGQPLFCDIDCYLKGKGFQLFDLRRYYWKRTIGVDLAITKGQIIFADALYFKTFESILEGLDIYKNNTDKKKAKVLKAISQCLIYGISDYALYLCDRAFNEKLFTSNERELIFKSVYKKRVGMSFRGQGRLARLFYKLYKYFKSGKFYFADEELGNE